MGSWQKVVCVKEVKQGMPEEEWNENMPLPGDIIEGVGVAEDEADPSSSVFPKSKSELSCQLARFNRQFDLVYVKVRRGNASIKLPARVVPERCAKLQRRFTIRAANDERHIVVLADLSLDRCFELQEMSRKVVNVMEGGGCQKQEVKYDWKKKVGTHLPDQRSTVISSILFMPFPYEHGIEAPTTRTMAWFSAAVTSGVPLVFVNIQTEQIITSEKSSPSGVNGQVSKREMCWGKQQSTNTTIQILQGIRLWFLPGLAEIPVTLTAELGETRFGMDIKRTEEGFICIYSVAKGSAADRVGLRQMREQAAVSKYLLVISRLEGKSLLPSIVPSTGLILCCDHNDVKDMLAAAIDQMEEVHLHIMAWPGQNEATGVPTLRPPDDSCTTETTFRRTTSFKQLNGDHFSHFA